jgi:signal peptidase
MHQVVNLGLIVTSALMIWKSLMVLTNSESPVVVVLRFPPRQQYHLGVVLTPL